MRRIWQVLRNTFIWSYERGSLPYDLMVIAILLFVFLSPRSWFRDSPRAAAEAHAGDVVLVAHPAEGAQTYRIEAHVVALPLAEEEMRERLAAALRAHVEELQDADFEISDWKPVSAPDGSLSHFEVTVRR